MHGSHQKPLNADCGYFCVTMAEPDDYNVSGYTRTFPERGRERPNQFLKKTPPGGWNGRCSFRNLIHAMTERNLRPESRRYQLCCHDPVANGVHSCLILKHGVGSHRLEMLNVPYAQRLCSQTPRFCLAVSILFNFDDTGTHLVSATSLPLSSVERSEPRS